MRLWHQSLIHYLPRQQLLGQHRECCALREKGWGKKHSVVDYVFKYNLAHLYAYHALVMHEMLERSYKVDKLWYSALYRGKMLDCCSVDKLGKKPDLNKRKTVYPEHDDYYLKECLDNLETKGAELENGESIAHMKLMLMLEKGI